MLGYTREDCANMMRGIRDGLFYLPPSAEESANNLRMAFDTKQIQVYASLSP